MIAFNTIVENGTRYGERYEGLRYQLALKADNAGPLTLSSFRSSIKGIDAALTADIATLVPGLNFRPKRGNARRCSASKIPTAS